jgi:hypothetical protein
MLGNDHFYHRSIRKVVVTFGSLFNDIEVIRFSKDETPKERFKVPLSFGTKEKYLTRITSDPNLTKSISVVVPRMAFFLNSFSYDHTRKQVTTLKHYAKGTEVVSQYIPVPYNFEFSLSIFVRNTEDGTQILEQILPFFTPDFTVTVDFIPSIERKYDVPFILESVNSNVDYEGDMSTVRLITWDLTFTAKGYIFPPVKGSGIIREVNANILKLEDSVKIVNVNIVPDPITAEPDDEYGFAETITEI